MNRPQLTSFLVIAFVFSLVLTGIARAAEKRTFSVAVQTPATNYTVHIENVYHAGDKIWVLARVKKIGDFGGQAITTVKDKVTIDAPAGDVVTYIVGKSWNWEDPKSYKYVSDKEMDALLAKQKKDGKFKQLYKRSAREKKKAR